MVRPSEDDKAAIDRAFAEMVAGYHLTADRPELPPAPPEVISESEPEPEPDGGRLDPKPIFRFVESPAAPPPTEAPADEPYEPEPLPPLRRPGIPALVGWIGMAYAVVVALAGTFGITFPTWAGWLAVAGFIGGFGILMSRLPRQRPPDAGDGAVL
jgi:hypothetical protein